MTWNQKKILFSAILFLLAAGGGFGVLKFLQGQSDLAGMGIFGNPAGTTVYLAGESCAINADLGRTGAQILEDAAWCVQQHEAWIAAHPVAPSATPIVDPAVPVIDPAAPVIDPLAPVTDPTTSVADPSLAVVPVADPAVAPVAPVAP
jgi:hypothetical protein